MTTYFNENYNKIMPRSFEFIAKEHRVFGTLSYDFTRYGLIDFVFKRHRKYVITEVELGHENNEVWSSFKCIAYRAAFCLDRGITIPETELMVILNQAVYHPNIINILAISNISYIFLNSSCEIVKMDIF